MCFLTKQLDISLFFFSQKLVFWVLTRRPKVLLKSTHVSVKIYIYLGPVIQSIISLTSSLVVKLLTVLESTIPNSEVFLMKKNVSSFCKSIFSAKILAYMPYLMIKVLTIC